MAQIVELSSFDGMNWSRMQKTICQFFNVHCVKAALNSESPKLALCERLNAATVPSTEMLSREVRKLTAQNLISEPRMAFSEDELIW